MTTILILNGISSALAGAAIGWTARQSRRRARQALALGLVRANGGGGRMRSG